jgi:hypothetical protein
MRRAFDPEKPYIRVTDEMSAEDFSRLAKKTAEVRCANCDRLIRHSGLDPKREWVCTVCSSEQEFELKLRPRMFYADNHIPYVKKPKRIELGSLILTGK